MRSFKVCSECGKEYEVTVSYRTSYCIPCTRKITRRAKSRWSVEKRLYNFAKDRARRRNIPFSITPADIVVPDICPILKTPIKRPSLDRLIPHKGYVPGNILVVSYRGNLLKSDASVDEARRVYEFLKSIHDP